MHVSIHLIFRFFCILQFSVFEFFFCFDPFDLDFEVPHLCDLWSCGVILFALVCGYLPFEDGAL